MARSHIVYTTAHTEHDHGLQVVQIGQAIDHQSRLRRTDTEIDHGAVHIRCIDDAKVALLNLAPGALGKGLDVLPEIGDQHMAAEIFQLAVGVALQCLSDVFVLLKPHRSSIANSKYRCPMIE